MLPATNGREGFFPTSKPTDLSQCKTLKQEFGGYLHICLPSVFLHQFSRACIKFLIRLKMLCANEEQSDKARGHTTYTEGTKAGAKLYNLPNSTVVLALCALALCNPQLNAF